MDRLCPVNTCVDASQEDGSPALHVVSLTQREEDVVAIPLEDGQLVHRPGLQILQAAWHPGSDVHFATLTSDNVFRLYHVNDLSLPVGAGRSDLCWRDTEGHCQFRHLQASHARHDGLLMHALVRVPAGAAD